MTAVLCRIASSGAEAPPAARQPVPVQDHRLLGFLRDLARRAQLSPPLAVESLCSLAEPAAPESYGLALMRSLDAVATRPLVFHPQGAAEASFDEVWLLRLLRCLEAGDTASARLLIGGRTGRLGRRTVGWLALGLAERLDRLALDEPSLEAFSIGERRAARARRRPDSGSHHDQHRNEAGAGRA